MLEMGLLVALGLIVMCAKLPWKGRVWISSHPLICDATVFVALNLIHMGTFSGVMVAAIGALFCSLTISVCRKVYGYKNKHTYVPGWMNVGDKLR